MNIQEPIHSAKQNQEPSHELLWRQQCARNLMDCYALTLESLGGIQDRAGREYGVLDALTRLLVDGMTAARGLEDEKAFYRTAAGLCREYGRLAGDKAKLFRVYEVIFGDMAGEEEFHETHEKH